MDNEKKAADLELLKKFLAEEVKDPGPYWTTDEATSVFSFESFIYGMAIVTRKSDGVGGFLSFADGEACLGEGHYCRLYFGFRPT